MVTDNPHYMKETEFIIVADFFRNYSGPLHDDDVFNVNARELYANFS